MGSVMIGRKRIMTFLEANFIVEIFPMSETRWSGMV